MFIVAGVALVVPSAVSDAVGFGLVIAALAIQGFRREMQPA